MASLSRKSMIGFIGGGTVGRALALALHRQGYRVVAASSRTFSSARAVANLVAGCTAYPTAAEVAGAAEFVFITTPDDAIGPVASSISWRAGQGVAHCSGAASLDALVDAERQGAATGAFHPLQTFSTVESAVSSLPGSTFAIEGDGEMRSYLKEMALTLGGSPIYLRPQDKPLYHASVVMMGGLVTGMAGAVAEMWKHFGIGREEAVKALAAIVLGDGAALRSAGVPGALAGPYVRGDVGTVAKHLNALRTSAPEMLPVYCKMALAGFPFALEKGNVPEEKVAEIRKMLMEASNE